MKRVDAIRKFYRSSKWKVARAIKITTANGICEKCGNVGTEVHHIIHLTKDNIHDPSIALNVSSKRIKVYQSTYKCNLVWSTSKNFEAHVETVCLLSLNDIH